MFTEWTGIAWGRVILAETEPGPLGAVPLVVALVIFTALAAIMIFLRREGRERRERLQTRQEEEGATPDHPAGS